MFLMESKKDLLQCSISIYKSNLYKLAALFSVVLLFEDIWLFIVVLFQSYIYATINKHL